MHKKEKNQCGKRDIDDEEPEELAREEETRCDLNYVLNPSKAQGDKVNSSTLSKELENVLTKLEEKLVEADGVMDLTETQLAYMLETEHTQVNRKGQQEKKANNQIVKVINSKNEFPVETKALEILIETKDSTTNSKRILATRKARNKSAGATPPNDFGLLV
ncbi:hypothetical protein K2173_025627 [Erythroxylum novogranatense]|uniref:Uncharacterized protein n=1 Tax=Erythroxylum novogranatense TaxID=1862640 RepID=A0AAV8SMU6_9ROSI|nr:hypothetical protein K2173_025627 [Erythroxylum novogranatense]